MVPTLPLKRCSSWRLVPGISFSPDKMLQARIMSYPDAQRYRLGANYQQLSVNQPKCPVMHYQRDTLMTLGNNGGNAPKQNSTFAEPASECTLNSQSNDRACNPYCCSGAA